jgi:D-aminopeptidase
MGEPVKVVVFIGSWSRSGSTLLDLMLGKVDGFFSAGELRLLWQRGAAENQLCGCARPFAECEVWSRVMGAGLLAAPQADARGALEGGLDAGLRAAQERLLLEPRKPRPAAREIEVKLDAEWQSRMPRSQAVEVTALTWPLLARYGYLDRSGTLLATRPPA